MTHSVSLLFFFLLLPFPAQAFAPIMLLDPSFRMHYLVKIPSLSLMGMVLLDSLVYLCLRPGKMSFFKYSWVIFVTNGFAMGMVFVLAACLFIILVEPLKNTSQILIIPSLFCFTMILWAFAWRLKYLLLKQQWQKFGAPPISPWIAGLSTGLSYGTWFGYYYASLIH